MAEGHNSYRNTCIGVERALKRLPKDNGLRTALQQLDHYRTYWHDQIIGMAGGHALDDLEPQYSTLGGLDCLH